VGLVRWKKSVIGKALVADTKSGGAALSLGREVLSPFTGLQEKYTS
jgi:hypothetical protein